MSRQKKETGLDKETGRKQETVSEETVEKETAETGKTTGRRKKPVKEMTGDGTHTIAELHGMTPEELIEKRGVPTSLARNNPPNQLGMIDDEGQEHDDGWANTNRGLLHMSLEISNLPDIDLRDAEAVRRRINEYFQIVANYGNKPTVAGLGLALNGMDRRRLWEIRTGQTQGRNTDELPKTVRDTIKKAYRLMENLWENYMQNGKINPVAGIFLGKNNFGYQDKTEYVVTPNQRQESDYSEAELRERYKLPPAPSNSESDFED
ncbi:MAG: hypothetical protein IJ523_07915 [Succinivibrionaceae bacterium]|nr:hypothetical protein [Succinivibrionaceae bacterium]